MNKEETIKVYKDFKKSCIIARESMDMMRETLLILEENRKEQRRIKRNSRRRELYKLKQQL